MPPQPADSLPPSVSPEQERGQAALEPPPWVHALLDPGAYPEPVSAVEVVETHVSRIFLTDAHAYKVKKPLTFEFLDFSTLERRRHFCQRELALNRRLSPQVYLEVVEIRRDSDRYAIDGPGETMEYAVKMRRMPAARVLERLLCADAVSADDIRRLAGDVARFHEGAEAGPEITRLGGFETVRRNVEANLADCARFAPRYLDPDALDDLVAYSQAFLATREHVFRRRAQEDRVRDCHGDLHAAQVYLVDRRWYFLDCIEFNDAFRYSDGAADIAFLAMDMDYHGRPDLSQVFVDAYVEQSGDPGVLELLDFFKAYRAHVRAKVSVLRLDQGGLAEEARTRLLATAQGYFRLARSYVRLPGPLLVVVMGLSGTGKTTVARELARRWGMEHVSSDVTRKRLAGLDPLERRPAPFGQGIYSAELSRRTYEAMLEQARALLKAGRSVVLDATFLRAAERAAALAVAKELGASAWLIECVLPDDEARRRLESRAQRGDSPSDAGFEVYLEQKRRWEAPSPALPASGEGDSFKAPPYQYIVLDTTGTTEENMRLLLLEIFTRALTQETAGRG